MNKLKQSTQLKQKKVLSHQTRQAINILQLNSLDLHKEIENIILENPFLEQDTLYGEAMTVASEPFARVNSLQFFLGLAELCCVHAQPVSMAVQMLR